MDDRSRIRKETKVNDLLKCSRCALAMVCVLAALSAIFAGGASAADFEIEPGITSFTATPGDTQAGAHPDLSFSVEWRASGFSCSERCLTPRVLRLHFPTGFIGNPHVAPKCTLAAFSTGTCSADSQMGAFSATFTGFFPAYNLETSEEQAGLVGFTIPLFNLPVFLELRGRTDSDYGLDSVGTPFLRAPLTSVKGTLWGVPADSVHNPLRFKTPLTGEGQCANVNGCTPGQGQNSPTFASPTVPAAPFLQNPTRCGDQLTSTVDLEYYADTEVHAQAPWSPMTSCQQLAFNPSQTTKPTTTGADSPTGIDVDLKVPQTQSPFTATPSQIQTNRVTLPEGFSINPGASDGKVACRDDETSIGTIFAATCPEFSKVGTSELDVSALPGPVFGGVYLGEPRPGDPYRLILTGDGFATHIKLPASIQADSETGRLVTAFEDLPQSPIQRVNLHFFGSERGLLATPEQCGTFAVQNEFVPWDSELTTRLATSFITISGGPNGSACPSGVRPFHPRVEVGTAKSTAGSFTPFTFSIDRDDGDQNLTSVSVATPPGFAAVLKGIPYCQQSAIDRLAEDGYSGRGEQASTACPAASQVGTVVAGTGAGTHPLYADGRVFLGGPYKGAPISLVVAVPAVSGPYDLGVVPVRVAVDVDPRTGQVSARSDTLPQILEGVPLRTRFIRVTLDRSNFSFNPTNCAPFSVRASLGGDEGSTASIGSHFQVSDCAELPYGPKLSIRLTGGVKRRGHPAIHATFTARPGEANTRAVSVLLPKGELLDAKHIGTVCTRVQFASETCPAGSVYGSAEVTTPLLDEPLAGSAYLLSSNNRLPDLAVDLSGQFDFELIGRVDSVKSRLRTRFQSVPDVPISRFKLDLRGGTKGLLQNSSSLCGGSPAATVRMIGQNGAAVATKSPMKVSCGRGQARSRGHHRSGK